MARSNTPFDTQQATETFYAMTECVSAYRTRFGVITSFHASQGSCFGRVHNLYESAEAFEEFYSINF